MRLLLLNLCWVPCLQGFTIIHRAKMTATLVLRKSCSSGVQRKSMTRKPLLTLKERWKVDWHILCHRDMFHQIPLPFQVSTFSSSSTTSTSSILSMYLTFFGVVSGSIRMLVFFVLFEYVTCFPGDFHFSWFDSVTLGFDHDIWFQKLFGQPLNCTSCYMLWPLFRGFIVSRFHSLKNIWATIGLNHLVV